MIITTTENIPNKEVIEILGIARGSTVSARNVAKDIFAALKGVIGGEISEYTKLQADSREQALQRMYKDDEKMDAFELGWRMRPSDRLLIELSLYHYDTKDAVFSGPPVYSTSNVKTSGGELTFDYQPSRTWHLKGGYSYSRGKKDSKPQDDFPESMVNLSSQLALSDNLTFIQSLYYISID